MSRPPALFGCPRHFCHLSLRSLCTQVGHQRSPSLGFSQGYTAKQASGRGRWLPQASMLLCSACLENGHRCQPLCLRPYPCVYLCTWLVPLNLCVLQTPHPASSHHQHTGSATQTLLTAYTGVPGTLDREPLEACGKRGVVSLGV
jgi:hypothetical protein